MSPWTELLQSVEHAEPSPLVPARALARAAELGERPTRRGARKAMTLVAVAAAASLVLAVLALAAHSRSSAPEPAKPPTAAQKAADLRQAVAMTPRLSDMPNGWLTDFTKAAPHKCTTFNDLQKTAQTGTKVTHAFKDPNPMGGPKVEGAAVMFATLSETETAYRRYISRATLACETKALESGIKSGNPNGTRIGAASSSIVNFPTIGEESQLARVDIPITEGGANADVYADVLFYRVGRGIGFLEGGNGIGPFPQTQLLHLARKLAARGKAAEPQG